MNKIIKNYIEEADYNEIMDIMEAAQNRITTISATSENAWESIFWCIKIVDDYKNRLHLMPVTPESYYCGCANYRRDYEN